MPAADHPVLRVWLPRGVFAASGVFTVEAVLAVANRNQWLGSPRLTVFSFADYATFGCLVVALQAAYLTSLSRRRGTDVVEGATVRGYWPAWLLTVGLGLAGSLGSGAAVAAALVWGWSRGAVPAGSDLWPLIATTAVYLSAAGVGATVGRFLLWPPLALLVAPAGWCLAALAIRSPAAENLLIIHGFGDPTVHLSLWFFLLQAVFYLSVLTLVRAITATPIYRITSVTAAALVGVAAAVLVVGGDGWYSTTQDQAAVVCQTGSVTLCLPSSEEVARDALGPMLAEAALSTRVVDDRPILFYSGSIKPGQLDHQWTAYRRLVPVVSQDGVGTAMVPQRNATLRDVVPLLVNPQGCPLLDGQVDDKPKLTSMGEVVYWQYAQLHLDFDGYGMPRLAEVDANPGDLRLRLARFTPAQVSVFFDHHRAQIRACKTVV